MTDSVFEVYNNLLIRKNVTEFGVNYGDNVSMIAGTGLSSCYLSLQDGLDANLTSLNGIVGLNAVNTVVSHDLIVNNNLYNSSNITIGSNLNVSQKSVLNGQVTCVSSLNVSGTSSLNGNVTSLGALNVSGVTALNNSAYVFNKLSVSNGNTYSLSMGHMPIGSMSIGDAQLDYGNQFYDTPPNYDGPDWTTNTASLMFECLDKTEIAVHAAALNKVSSLLSYVGTTNTLTLGRNMGWGVSSVAIAGNLTGPNIMKKQIFNFTCSTPTVINGTTYYRYDINLNLYKTFYSRYSGTTLFRTTRKFK